MILAGTGHRPNKLGGYSDKALDKLVHIILNKLEELKPSKVISGMALGFDTALALAAIRLNIPIIAAIPCKNQWAKWPNSSINTYQNILQNNLVTIHNISTNNYTSDCMQKRNIWMIDNCDKVLTIFDGSNGGTKNCINYAVSKDKEIINLYEEYIK